MKTVMHVAGARPNFMKVAPVFRAIARRGGLRQILVHTGQHYDAKMSDVFFTDLGLPQPDAYLGVGSGSQAVQTAKVMIEMEKAIEKYHPDLVSVVGDVNSTMAATLVAAKLLIRVAHIEAGLRSFDRTMPEEINRIVTDRLADYLLTPSPEADENLRREGVDPKRIARVGNVMIDSLLISKAMADQLATARDLGLEPGRYAVCTLHRPANVDDPKKLAELVSTLGEISRKIPVVFPVHPRTRKVLIDNQVAFDRYPGLRLIEPLGYLEFLSLTSRARFVLTDSGGLQEEATVLSIPCLTLRENTERPITVSVGTNIVVGTDPRRILSEADKILAGNGKRGRIPDLWDGKAGERIAAFYERVMAE